MFCPQYSHSKTPRMPYYSFLLNLNRFICTKLSFLATSFISVAPTCNWTLFTFFISTLYTKYRFLNSIIPKDIISLVLSLNVYQNTNKPQSLYLPLECLKGLWQGRRGTLVGTYLSLRSHEHKISHHSKSNAPKPCCLVYDSEMINYHFVIRI